MVNLNLNFHIFAFALFGVISFIVWKKFGLEDQIEDTSLFYNWWSVPWDAYIMTYFFRPMATLTRPMAPHDLDIEEGMELLIERLAVPNLWLQPVISSDYIKDLPTWFYQSRNSDDATNSTDQTESSSEEESFSNRCFCNCKGPNQKSNSESCKDDEAACSSVAGNEKDLTSENKSSHKKCLVHNCEVIPRSSKHSFQRSKNSVSSDVSQIENTGVPPGMLESSECSICLDFYVNGSILCGLPCGHSYHVQCILVWLYRDNHCCPVCRWPSYKPKLREDVSQHLHLS